MITIRIGNDSRRLEDVEESWIAQHVNNRQREGLQVCVEVTIKTPACGPGGAGGRAPKPDERRSSSFGRSTSSARMSFREATWSRSSSS